MPITKQTVEDRLVQLRAGLEKLTANMYAQQAAIKENERLLEILKAEEQAETPGPTPVPPPQEP